MTENGDVLKDKASINEIPGEAPQNEEPDGRITGGFTDGGIFGGKCKYCGEPIVTNDGLGLRQEICRNCGKPQEPEIFGNEGQSQ
jgi:uncharacterized OB-fold protein